MKTTAVFPVLLFIVSIPLTSAGYAENVDVKTADIKDFSIVVLEEKWERDEWEDIRQIAFLKGKKLILQDILTYIKSETNLGEKELSPELETAFAYFWMNSLKSTDAAQEESEGRLKLTIAAVIELKLLDKIVENTAPENQSLAEALSLVALSDSLLAEMERRRNELKEAEYYQIKELREKRQPLNNQFRALEWFERGKRTGFKEQIECLNSAIELAPDWDFLYRRRGFANLNAGNRDFVAVQDYSKAIELNPDELAAYEGRARAYLNMEIFDKALADYDLLVMKRPDKAHAFSMRANAYSRQGEIFKAIEDYDRAIEIEPNEPHYYNQRAYCYKQKGDYELALADFSRALEIDPEFHYAHSGKGYLYLTIGENEKAIAEFTRVIEIAPDEPYGYCSRGMAYFRMGESEKARIDLKKAADMGDEMSEKLLKQWFQR